MDVISSTEFRKHYHQLTKPVIVSVNGHQIGTWRPTTGAIVFDRGAEDAIDLFQQEVEEHGSMFPTGPPKRVPAQTRRDELLNKINKR